MVYSKDKNTETFFLEKATQFILQMTILVPIITVSKMNGRIIRIQPITLSKDIL